MTFSLLQREQRPKLWRELLDKVAEVNRAGFDMKAQGMGRPIGIMLGFEISQNPFIGRPSWREIKDLPLAEKLVRLRSPEFRGPTARGLLARFSTCRFSGVR